MTKKQFNMTDWLNKKPDTTNQKNTDQEKSVQIREIRGGKNTISVNSCQFVDQGKSVSPSSVDCCQLSVDFSYFCKKIRKLCLKVIQKGFTPSH